MIHRITGKVIKGLKFGRQLGFPTANLDRRQFSRLPQKPRLGVWAGRASFRHKGKNYQLQSAIVIGPLDNKNLPKIEAHLIGFSGSLYGEKIILNLKKFLRPFRQFPDEAALKRQIQADVKHTMQL